MTVEVHNKVLGQPPSMRMATACDCTISNENDLGPESGQYHCKFDYLDEVCRLETFSAFYLATGRIVTFGASHPGGVVITIIAVESSVSWTVVVSQHRCVYVV